jgi:hypothetical protein
MGVAFRVVGEVPDQAWLDDDLAAFAERLKAMPWGGDGYDRLVIGDINASLREWMKPAEYKEWQAGHTGGRIAATGAKAFIAHDGLRTAAVLPLSEQFSFLMFACHEMVEAVLGRRHDAEGHQFKEQTHTSLAHVLWTEYVVERTRRVIANQLDWGYAEVENGFVVEQMQDIENELPDLIQWAVQHNEPPQRLFQHWYEMARVYAMTLGRGDAGSPQPQEELRRFKEKPLVTESSAGWGALDQALRDAYDRPTEPAYALDQLVRNEGWMPLYEAMTVFWNARYEKALSA